MQLINYIPNLKHVSTTQGGEYKGPCFSCGGRDRLIVHPTQAEGLGLYQCRQCKKSGNGITYLTKHYNPPMTYYQACEALNVQPDMSYQTININDLKNQNKDKTNEPFIPKEPGPTPNRAWRIKSEAILFSAHKYLLSSKGAAQREYLNNRGINLQSIKSHRLGYIPSPLTYDPSSFGFDQDTDHNTIWFPQGIIIPFFYKNILIRLRIRQNEPLNKSRYILVAGSSTVPMLIGNKNKPFMIVESELDAILAHQEAGDVINTISLGNAQARPDKILAKKLKQSKLIISLDNDQAGITETKWWLRNFPKSKNYPPTKKDLGEMFLANINIYAWVKNAVGVVSKKVESNVNIKSKPQPRLEPKQQIVKRQTTAYPQTCIHGQFCQHVEQRSDKAIPEIIYMWCLIENKSAFRLDICPKGNWVKDDVEW